MAGMSPTCIADLFEVPSFLSSLCLMDNGTDIPLEEQDAAEELHHELDNKVQDAMKAVVEAENRKAAALKVRDDAKQFLVDSLLGRIARCEERRQEAEIAWKGAIEWLQEGLKGEDTAEANLDAATEALQRYPLP